MMNESLKKDLLATGYIHAPLPLHEEKTVEARFEKKKVLESRLLWANGEGCTVRPDGDGSVAVIGEGGERLLRMTAPVVADHWPEGAPADGEYANFGTLAACLAVEGENWERYNRIRLRVRPDSPGARVVHLNMAISSDGEIKIPDEYFREGCHVFNLKNHVWNDCIWEFNAMPRDRATQIRLYVFLCGKDTSTGDYVRFDVNGVEVQRVADPEPEKGWQPAPGRITFSTTGYWKGGPKTAVANVEGETFEIVEAESGEAVFAGRAKRLENGKGTFRVLDFTPLDRPGRFRIQMNGVKTEAFEIGGRILENAVWKAINFLYCERCGYPVPGRHGICHGDMVCEHNGLKLSFSGGWHDAGDVSQQMAQSAEIAQAVFEMAERASDDQPLRLRLLEEAEWGLEFILRTRFGDGYRATSAPGTRWTQGKMGDMDDITVRGHNHAFENFLCAGVEAYAAHALRSRDPELAWKCGEVSREDFRFALERFEKTGVELPSCYEHTYNSGLSQYYATASWAASGIYRLTRDGYFAAQARKFADKLLLCQETGGAGLPIRGFFYRDETHRSIVHFNHQSREQAFMQALELLCATQRGETDLGPYEEAMRLYGEYLKSLMKYTQPYGMLPAGVYAYDEAEDAALFKLMHRNSEYGHEKPNFIEQLKAGVRLDDRHVVRCFPVWFSFRGNTVVQLAMGKAASILGRYFGDAELTDIAREQMYWVLGKNPFGQSLMYGEGSNYPHEYAVLPGEMVGELPVGIETCGNEDAPYWPQNNNATYKEVWTSAIGRWLWLAADLY